MYMSIWYRLLFPTKSTRICNVSPFRITATHKAPPFTASRHPMRLVYPEMLLKRNKCKFTRLFNDAAPGFMDLRETPTARRVKFALMRSPKLHLKRALCCVANHVHEFHDCMKNIIEVTFTSVITKHHCIASLFYGTSYYYKLDVS